MKKLLLLLLCVPLIGLTQDKQYKGNKYKIIETEIIGEFPNYVRILKSTRKPVTGIVCTYYPDGQMIGVEMQFVDGHSDGDFRWYHKNGRLAVQGLVDDKGEFLFPDTFLECWDEEGKVVDCESHVIDGEPLN